MQWIAKMIKPLLRTLILASILFFLLVYMGMKYHWNELLKKQETPTTLEIPSPQSSPEVITPQIIQATPEGKTGERNNNNFQPEIIKNTAATSPIDAMTKEQIFSHCENLYKTSLNMADVPNIDLLIGNCVVSNYQEPFEISMKSPQEVKQEQNRKIQAIKKCRQILFMDNKTLSNIEAELRIGICASNLISQ